MNKYAIIGLGFIYPRHKQSIEATGGQVILTCDSDPKKEADFLDWRAMFVSEKFKEVDTVVICTPNYLHSTMASMAVAAGKKVICEKPLCLDFTEIPRLLQRDIMPILQLRYHPKIIEAKQKKVKQIDMAITMFRKEDYFTGWKGDWRRSGGLLFNLGIHYLDLLTYFLGAHTHIKKSESNIVGYDDIWDEWFEAEIEHEHGTSRFFVELFMDKGQGWAKKPSRQITLTYEDGTKEDIELSQQENLSYEGLHLAAYQDFISGKGLRAEDALPSLILASELYQNNKGK